jgi:hypothetical protein
MTNQELLQQTISKLSNEEKAAIYPPIERKNFVVRKSWMGRNQIITFVNNKNQKISCHVGSNEVTGHKVPICLQTLDKR